ncbi:hypothetical protein [Sphingomonas sp.]|uniref:hypothetical protein n=1 Tax=Sphingomonas sp. TaxID=28214 RepID=UPI001B2443C4|nr:hypothetical protein [Sphingomonas sp.]MBO9712560.1 hypothetical protein [Sphingomonas sp.]
MGEGDQPFPDRREAWSSPYRGIEFGITAKWLILGAFLYALLLLGTMAANTAEAIWPIVGPSLYCTPFFGLPYVLATINRPGRTRRILFFLILLPLIHVAANYLAWRNAVENYDELKAGRDLIPNLISGGIGGLAGAALSFGFLEFVQLSSSQRFERLSLLLGVVLLTAMGALGLAYGLQLTDALREPRVISHLVLFYEMIHFPWQLLFAVLLAWLMRKPREPRPKRLNWWQRRAVLARAGS